MASNTTRFGLLKKDPIADGNDTFNIQTMLNDNWDKLDSAAKKSELDAHANDTTVHITAAERTTWNNKAEKSVATQTADGLMSKTDKAKLDGIEAGAQKNTVNSVNNKTGIVILSAADVGAETPSGAQEKADQAEQNAKDYADQELVAAKEYTDQQLVAAKAYTDTAPEAMQRNFGQFLTYRSGKDSNGVFTTVDYKRSNGTLFASSVLSNADTNGNYQTRTITYYAADGSTVVRTDTWTLTYDADGDLVSEVKS